MNNIHSGLLNAINTADDHLSAKILLLRPSKKTLMKNFIEELRWRNMIQDVMPGTEDLLNKQMVKGYIGFDPTSDSLGVGNLVQIMTLLHFQQCGHKPIALIDRKSTRLNSSHVSESRMPSSA